MANSVAGRKMRLASRYDEWKLEGCRKESDEKECDLAWGMLFESWEKTYKSLLENKLV